MKKTIHQFPLSYSQVVVFNSNLDAPFNEWSVAHFNQGFSWRENSVSFNTILDSGICNLSLYLNEPYSSGKFVRVIAVPFIIDSSENIEIGSIEDTFQLKIESGSYEIIFAIEKVTEESNRVDISIFINKSSRKSAEILVEDSLLSPSLPLLVSV